MHFFPSVAFNLLTYFLKQWPLKRVFRISGANFQVNILDVALYQRLMENLNRGKGLQPPPPPKISISHSIKAQSDFWKLLRLPALLGHF